MKSIIKQLDLGFEKLVNLALKIFGHPITFIAAIICVIVYIWNDAFFSQNIHDKVRDIILCITFLSFFIIQKAFNKYNAAIHLKMNELVAAQENASNKFVKIEDKTEEELNELAKDYEKKIKDNEDKDRQKE